VPRVRIVYCVPCGYLPRAVQLATDLLNRYGTRYLKDFSVTLETGDGGVFDVYVDERSVYSRKSEGGKFPTVEDVAKHLG
jgi:selenoprotein W-related protein